MPKAGDDHRISVLKEVLVLAVVCLALYLLALYFKVPAALYGVWGWAEDFLLLLLFLTGALAYFSYRRYDRAKRILESARELERDRDVFEKIVMTSTDAMTFIDRDYRFTAVNDMMVKVWGRSRPEEFIGHHISEFIGEDLFRDVVKAYYDRCFRGEQVIDQQWYEFEGYSKRFLYFIYNPYFESDGTVSGAVVVATNLTELKEAEEALRRSEVRFRKLFELGNSATVLIRMDDHTVADVNEQFVLDFGRAREAVIGQPVRKACPCSDQAELEGILNELPGAGSVRNRELTVQLDDGRTRDVLLSASLMTLDDGEHVLFSTQDITELKDAQRRIRRSLEEKKVLLKEIHHRVKNNMAVVSSLLSLQSRYIEDGKYLDMFRESQERIRAMALVHEQLYRSEDFGRIDVRAYVKSLVENIQNAHAGSRRVTVGTSIGEIYMELDNLVPLGLIMNEIVSNAFKHAFAGVEAPGISIEMTNSGEKDVTLTISDNGVGLPDGFDAARSGTLGLRIVGLLTKQMNGTMDMVSENGVRFTMVFPEKMEIARHLINDG